MNFRIIENHNTGITDYEAFKTDFTNPSITVKELTTKYDLSRKQYNTLREKVLKETGLTSKPYKTMKNNSTKIIHENTYIRKINNYYFIQKKINGKRKSFGTYEDINTARKVRDKLIENNWDTFIAKKLQDKYSKKRKTLIQEALQDYDDFIELYNKGINSEQIKQTLKLTNYQYNNLIKIMKKNK